jgi:hypothetical protein
VGILPDSNAFLAGRPVEAAQWSRVADLTHHAWARANRARLSMSWQGLALQGTGGMALTSALLQPWRCPVTSAAHTALRWYALAECTGVGELWMTSAGVGAGAVIPVGAPAWVTGTVTVASGAPWYDDLTLWHSRAAGETLTVYALGVEVEPLASPLSTTPVDTATGGRFVGLGSATLAGDYPLSAARLRTLVEDTAELMAMPRVHLGWAGVSDDVAGVKDIRQVHPQPGRPYATLPRVGGAVQYHALCRQLATPTVLVIQAPGAGALGVTVPGGAADVWVAGTYTPTQDGTVLPSLPDHYPLAVQASASGDRPVSTARILSLSVWGP